MTATKDGDGESLEIRVLGTLKVARDGRPCPLPRSCKTRALLAWLALAERATQRDELCELLWDDTTDPRGELRWSLSKLRAVLGRWLILSGDSVAIGGAGLTIDAVRFRLLASANAPECDVRQALQLWRGNPLADADVAGSIRFHNWWLARCEALTELHRQAQRALVDATWSSPDRALAAARDLVVHHPHDEWGHARVAQTLRRIGRAADARDHVDATRRTLSRELDIPPASVLAAMPAVPYEPREHGAVPMPGGRPARPRISVRPLRLMPWHEPLDRPGALLGAELEHGLWCGQICDVVEPGPTTSDSPIYRELSYSVRGTLSELADGIHLCLHCANDTNNTLLWSGHFGPERQVARCLPDWVHRAIGGMHAAIQLHEMRRALRAEGLDRSVHDRLMAAQALCVALEPAANRRALDILHAMPGAEQEEPLAMALLSWCHAQRCVYNWTANPDRDRAESQRYATEAVRRADGDPHCLTIIGAARSIVGDQTHARRLLDRALDLNPHSSWAYARGGWVANYTDDPARAITQFRASLELSPIGATAFNDMIGLGVAYYIQGDDCSAIDWMEKGLAIQPDAVWVYRNLVPAYASAGRMAEAEDGVSALMNQNASLSVAAVENAMVFSRPTMARIASGLSAAGLPVF